MRESTKQFIALAIAFCFSFSTVFSPSVVYAIAKQSTASIEGVQHSALPFAAKSYVIKKKDKISKIAKRYNISGRCSEIYQ